MIIGDKEVFAIDLTWTDCPVLADDGQRATWALIQIFCSGVSLTRHLIVDDVQHEVVGPASTIAEWIGSNWAALMHEERALGAPRAIDGHELLSKLSELEWETHESELDLWWRSHCLRGANQGFLLPDILFWRKGSAISVSWKNDPEPRTERKVQFLPGTSSARIPVSCVEVVFKKFVEETAAKIESADKNSAAREAVLAGREKLRLPWHQQLDVLAVKLGRSEAALSRWLAPEERSLEEMRHVFDTAYGANPEAYLNDMADSEIAMAARSASPAFTEADHEKLLAFRREMERLPTAVGFWQLRGRLLGALGGVDAEEPWGGEDHQLGYRLARELRRLIRNKSKFIDVEGFVSKLGVKVLDAVFDDLGTDGVTLWRKDACALVVVNEASPRSGTQWGRRTVLAHELYHLLADSVEGHVFGECTSQFSPSPSERRANAFAAELLLPAVALPAYLHVHPEFKVREICGKYGVGWELCVRQLVNHKRITRDLAQALLDDVEIRHRAE